MTTVYSEARESTSRVRQTGDAGVSTSTETRPVADARPMPAPVSAPTATQSTSTESAPPAPRAAPAREPSYQVSPREQGGQVIYEDRDYGYARPDRETRDLEYTSPPEEPSSGGISPLLLIAAVVVVVLLLRR